MNNLKQKEYYLYCGIKSMWHGKKISDFHNDPEALEKVQKYLSEISKFKAKGIGLYLWGSNGTGKSHLLNTAMKELCSKKYNVRVFSMDEIIDKFTVSWHSDSERAELDNILRNKDFIGIDEFGKNLGADGKPVYIPDLAKRVMESVIRYRVQMGKPIWFASNTDPKNVCEVFSEDVASLLREAVIPICVRGEDYRKEIQRRNKLLLK